MSSCLIKKGLKSKQKKAISKQLVMYFSLHKLISFFILFLFNGGNFFSS